MALSLEERNNLLETLLRLQDKPYDYNHLIARILTDLIDSSLQQSIQLIDGVPMILDTGRSKMLSLTREVVSASSFGLAVTNRYLKFGEVPGAGKQGYVLPRKATITGMWAKSRSLGAWLFEVRKNGVELTVASINVVGGSGSTANIDIDLEAGDTLQLFASGVAEHPIVNVELAWRN